MKRVDNRQNKLMQIRPPKQPFHAKFNLKNKAATQPRSRGAEGGRGTK